MGFIGKNLNETFKNTLKPIACFRGRQLRHIRLIPCNKPNARNDVRDDFDIGIKRRQEFFLPFTDLRGAARQEPVHKALKSLYDGAVWHIPPQLVIFSKKKKPVFDRHLLVHFVDKRGFTDSRFA